MVQLISSQIDVDRMDYLLRDAYFTGCFYGKFDNPVFFIVIRPIENGIMPSNKCMHAVRDYVVSRYQMYIQVYFHPAIRAMKSSLKIYSKRARTLSRSERVFSTDFHLAVIHFEGLSDHLNLDDGVMNTYFQNLDG